MSIIVNFPWQPAINYFRVIRHLISTNIHGIASRTGQTADEVYADVLKHLRNNSSQWRSNSIPAVPYQDPLCRIAYLYGIVPVNANLIESIFTRDSELAEYFDSVRSAHGEVSICGFGGGPGTELLGITKWAERRRLGQPVTIDFLLVDRVPEWADSWLALQDQIRERFGSRYGLDRRSWPLWASGNFIPIDVSSGQSLYNWGAVFRQQLYVVCYLITDIFENFQDLRNFTAVVATHAPPGSKFLFVDRKGDRWEKEIKELAGQAGLKLSDIQYTTSNMSNDEQAADLGQVITDLRGQHPRLTWDAFWVVGTKQ